MTFRIYVGLGRRADTPVEAGLGEATLVAPNLQVWFLSGGAEVLPAVAESVLSGRIASAYVTTNRLPEDKSWLATEWHRRIVADPDVAQALERLLTGWTPEHQEEAGVVVFTASEAAMRASRKAQSRDRLTTTEPDWWDIDTEDALRDPVGWFGEFGRDDVGGWVTLMSGFGVASGGSARIGNFAALGLRVERGGDSLWNVRKSGGVDVAAIGLTRDQLRAGGESILGLESGRFDMSPLERSDASYCVAVRIDAPVDPKVVIGSGTVFEQLGPGQTQNLAVAAEWHDTIDAGQIIGIVLPAWCINRHLSPPSGESLRLTPLAFSGKSDNQQTVWDDIARRRTQGARG